VEQSSVKDDPQRIFNSQVFEASKKLELPPNVSAYVTTNLANISANQRLASRLNSNEEEDNNATDNTLYRLLDGISEISTKGGLNHMEMGGTTDLFIDASP
jgi:hypothetical protein